MNSHLLIGSHKNNLCVRVFGGVVLKVWIFHRKSFSNIHMKLCSDHSVFCEKIPIFSLAKFHLHTEGGGKESTPFRSKKGSWSPLLLGHLRAA